MPCTSTNRSRKVPDGGVSGVGDAGERGMAVQDVAGNAAVPHAVSHSKTTAATEHRLGRDAGVSTRCTVEFCRMGSEREGFNIKKYIISILF